MIGPIFSINAKGEFGVADDRLYLVPVFRSLLALKEGTKLMQYVYCICDYYSPYIRISDPDERELKASKDIFNGKVPAQYVDAVKEAVMVYRDMQEHPLMEQYDVMKRMRSNMQKKIDAMGLEEKSRPTDIMNLSQQLVKYTMDMETLEGKIKEKNTKIGGLSNLKRSLSIYEERVYKKQRTESEQ